MSPIEPIPGLDDYGRTAIRAVQLFREDDRVSPSDAWLRAAAEFPISAKDPDKTCPMSSFLILCEEGHITGIRGGVEFIWGGLATKRNNIALNKPMTQSVQYTREAVKMLMNDSLLAREAMADTAKAKDELHRRLEIKNTSNSQLDVVLALWIKRLFAAQC